MSSTQLPLASPHSTWEIFTTFLKLGCISFGGPIAHIGYFRQELVLKKQWLGEAQFGQLLAIAQFLPGPASSQLGFSLGLMHGGLRGGLAAFAGFTLPSALLLICFGLFLPHFDRNIAVPLIHSLKILALVVVANGLVGMFQTLCTDARTASIAGGAAAGMILFPTGYAQLLIILGGALLGWLWCRPTDQTHQNIRCRYSVRATVAILIIFSFLLLGFVVLNRPTVHTLSIAHRFYQAGSLVFGGGHVVLPVLQQSLVGQNWLSNEQFLAGYGAAQMIPGPMFSLSAYLGFMTTTEPIRWWYATVALIAIFLPGFLLMAAALPVWQRLGKFPTMGRMVIGVNAAVVGLLLAALYNPLWVSTIHQPPDLAIAILAFVLLRHWKVPILLIATCCLLGVLLLPQIVGGYGLN
ncbi:MAG: chromate efflux transporter [Zavarzinella sp.]